jgi:hypothetical protein
MNRTSRAVALAALVCLITPASQATAACRAHSEPHRVSVLELYTSEGCSSCPPADRWLSALPRRGFTSAQVIPLAFHVDYWNELGWPDRFSQPAFSARQRRVNERLEASVIYTPQIVLDGRDLRLAGGMGQLQAQVTAANRRAPGATIDVDVQPGADRIAVSARVDVPDPTARGKARAWIAVFENGLSSRVTRGENAGRELAHDFVVHELAGPFPLQQEGQTRIEHRALLPGQWKPEHSGVAVLVQREDTGEYLQAASVPLSCP